MSKIKSEKLIVFDLDETLVHSTENLLQNTPDFQIEHLYVYKRPGLEGCLNRLSDFFHLAVWSSADEGYVQKVAENIFPNRFQFVWGRSECWFHVRKRLDNEAGRAVNEYLRIKPLKKLVKLGYSMKNLLIVDDTEFKVMDNSDNYILINPFNGDVNDVELEKLTNYLCENASIEDFGKLPSFTE